MVKIQPCAKKYENKTFLGFLIGDIACGSSISIKEDKIQLEFSGHNPAIFVPELRKVVYGCESWWSEIESEEDFKDITEDDIQNTWYVKLMKTMTEKKEAARHGLEENNEQKQNTTNAGLNQQADSNHA